MLLAAMSVASIARFGDRQGVAKSLVMSFYEASDQYGPGNMPFQFPTDVTMFLSLKM